MNTKKLDNESTPKGGKDKTRVVLTTAGAMAVGAGTGLAGATILRDHGDQEETTDEPATDEQATVAASSDSAATGTAAASNATSHHALTGGSSTVATSAPTETENTTPPAASGDVEAEAVAQQILGKDDLDPDDLDPLVDINFEQTDVFYTENGDEIPVAEVSTPDGSTYLLADVNGDRVYDLAFDMDGNIVGGVQAGLNTNDAQLALNDEGYIPITEGDSLLQDSGLEEDIIPLDDTSIAAGMEEIEYLDDSTDTALEAIDEEDSLLDTLFDEEDTMTDEDIEDIALEEHLSDSELE